MVKSQIKLAINSFTIQFDEQIAELMASLPPQLRDRSWSMAELTSRLVGKYRDKPHAQHVAVALAQLGWHRVRRWSQGYDGVRV